MKRISNFIIAVISSFLVLTQCAPRTTPEEAGYQSATSALEAGELETALSLFEELGDYEDAPIKAVEIRYDIAIEKYDNEEYDEAALAFIETARGISSIVDVEARAKEAYRAAQVSTDSAQEEAQKSNEYAEAATNRRNEADLTFFQAAPEDRVFIEITEEKAEELYAQYKECISLYDDCQMHIYGDYDFINALIEVCKYRTSKTEKDSSDIISAERMKLDEYRIFTFYSSELAQYRDNYFEGLTHQDQSTRTDNLEEAQHLWFKGAMERADALSAMDHAFGIFSEEPELRRFYVSGLPGIQDNLRKVEAIQNDFSAQYSGPISFTVVDAYHWKLLPDYTNNTGYKMDFIIYTKYYKNGNFVGQDSTVFSNVGGGETVALVLDSPLPKSHWDHCSFSVNYYFS